MAVNESEEKFATFVDRHSKQFSDEIFRLQNEVYKEGPLMEKDTDLDQQFGDVTLSHNDPRSQICHRRHLKNSGGGTRILHITRKAALQNISPQ